MFLIFRHNRIGFVNSLSIVDRDRGARFGERDGNRSSDAPRCACHQRSMAV
jgi:hypothetical protein